MVYAKVRDGYKLRDYVTKQFVPDEGMLIDETDLYWARRLNDGDMVVCDPPGPAAPADAPAAAPEA